MKHKYFQHDEEEPVYDRENRIAENNKRIKLLEEEIAGLDKDLDSSIIQEIKIEITALKFNNSLLED